jgi:hypothetical protein
MKGKPVRTAILLLAALPALAGAAPADWKSYLCRYGDGETRLIRVNEKDQRVVVDDLDANAVKMTEAAISFEPRGGGHWSIVRDTGKLNVLEMHAYGPTRILPGDCRQVDG